MKSLIIVLVLSLVSGFVQASEVQCVEVGPSIVERVKDSVKTKYYSTLEKAQAYLEERRLEREREFEEKSGISEVRQAFEERDERTRKVLEDYKQQVADILEKNRIDPKDIH